MPNLDLLLRDSSTNVLETMFFSSADPADPATTHTDPLACALTCSGAHTGAFTVAIDRAALQVLCEAFYGDDGPPTVVKERELLCELTNMLAGSTLSAYAPENFCPLSSPMLCDLTRHQSTAQTSNTHHATTLLAIDDGLLSVSCTLQQTQQAAA